MTCQHSTHCHSNFITSRVLDPFARTSLSIREMGINRDPRGAGIHAHKHNTTKQISEQMIGIKTSYIYL